MLHSSGVRRRMHCCRWLIKPKFLCHNASSGTLFRLYTVPGLRTGNQVLQRKPWWTLSINVQRCVAYSSWTPNEHPGTPTMALVAGWVYAMGWVLSINILWLVTLCVPASNPSQLNTAMCTVQRHSAACISAQAAKLTTTDSHV